MAVSMRKLGMVVALGSILGGLSCTWTDADTENWIAMLLVGSIIGTVIGIVLIVLGSLPVCCGILKPQAKIIAGVILGLGLVIMFIPAIAGKIATDGAIDKYCDRCQTLGTHAKCTDADRSKAKEDVGALGIVIAYLHGMGFLCIITGIAAMSLGCCIFCKCCKMKDDLSGGQMGAPQGQVVGQVVGQPVAAEEGKVTA